MTLRRVEGSPHGEGDIWVKNRMRRESDFCPSISRRKELHSKRMAVRKAREGGVLVYSMGTRGLEEESRGSNPRDGKEQTSEDLRGPGESRQRPRC